MSILIVNTFDNIANVYKGGNLVVSTEAVIKSEGLFRVTRINSDRTTHVKKNCYDLQNAYHYVETFATREYNPTSDSITFITIEKIKKVIKANK